jgi:iron complex outermembrane recepter protein
MKRNLLLLLLLQTMNIFGQNSLTGIIKHKATGEVLPGAIIYLPELKSAVLSQTDGNYQLNKLPKIKTVIQVKLLGYKTVAKIIDLQTVSQMDFELEESVIEEEEIVVTGTSHATELKRSPVPVVSINSQFLTESPANNIIEALNKVPGISALSTGPNISKPYIRGLGYNRILTLFDGVRQDGQQWGDEHGIEVDQFLVDHAEVVKGPASLIYGSDALAGVVNLLPAFTAPEGRMKGSFTGNYQTNNKQIGTSLALAGNHKGFVWGLRVSQKQASTYKNRYDGNVFGTKYDEKDLNAYVGLNKSWGYSRLNFSLYDNSQEVPDGARDSSSRKFVKQISEEDTIRPIVSNAELNSYAIGVIHQRVRHYRVYLDNSFILGKCKLGLKLGAQQSHRQEFSHPLHASVAGLNLILNTATYDVKLYLPELKGVETTIGINGMYQQNKNNEATEFVIPDYTSFDAGPFVYFKKEFKKIDIHAGLRYDVRSFNNSALYTKPDPETGFDMITAYNNSDTTIVKQFDAYSHTFSGLSGSLGTTFNLNENFYLKFNLARGYRSPNIAEISAKGVHPGTGFEQLGDANFKPEFSLQEDLGLFFDNEHISASAEAFNNIIDNYIYNEKLSSLLGGDSIYTESGNSYPVFKFRQTKAQLYGGEFSLDIHPHPLDWLHFENTASFIYAVNLGGNGAVISDSTRYLPYIPPFHTNSELRADIKKKIACFSGIYVRAGLQYYAAQDRFYSAYGTETKTASYTLIDAGLGFNVVNKKNVTLLSFNFSASNLSDAAYQSNMSRLKYFDNYPNNQTGRSGIYNMGRNFSFKLIIPLDLDTGK